MTKELSRLSNNKRVRRILEGRTTPDSELQEEQINSCSWCNAELPSDVEFQSYHMLKVHGLKV